MILDSLLSFVPVGSALSLVAGAGVDIPSTNVIDLLGSGVGTEPHNIIGNAATFGADAGIGAVKPQVEVIIGTGLVTGGGATLNVAFQAAADQGAAGAYQPGTWQTLVETGEMTAAQLVASAICARFDFPPVFPLTLRPRYLRLLFQVPAGLTFTAGTISAALVTMVRDDLAQRQATKNFTVA